MFRRQAVPWCALLLLLAAGVAEAETARFFMGEDIHGPDGLLISVNQVQRQAFTGGLSSEKKEQIEVQLTFVSTGRASIPIDPGKDFTIGFGGTPFPPVAQAGAGSLDRPFTVNPGTQSRGSLVFLVPVGEVRGSPELRFTGAAEPLVVVCDPDLAVLFDKSQAGPLGPDDGLKLGRHLYEAGRYLEARQVLDASLGRAGADPRLLLQMALVEQKLGNQDESRAFLTRISLQARLDLEDALLLARQAFELGEYPLAQRVLEPLAGEAALADKELLLLARVLYYQKEYDRAEKMLQDLQSRGFSDKVLFFTLGNVAEKRDDLNGAMRWWEKAYQADPTYYEALFNLGVGYYKTDDRQKAGEAWRKVLLLNPDPETRQIAEDALHSLE